MDLQLLSSSSSLGWIEQLKHYLGNGGGYCCQKQIQWQLIKIILDSPTPFHCLQAVQVLFNRTVCSTRSRYQRLSDKIDGDSILRHTSILRCNCIVCALQKTNNFHSIQECLDFSLFWKLAILVACLISHLLKREILKVDCWTLKIIENI